MKPSEPVDTRRPLKKASSIPQRNKRILAAGDHGTGKTAQIATLAPPVLVYAFDPNVIDTLYGFDIDIADFTIAPEEIERNMKAFRKTSSKTDMSNKPPEPRAYIEFIDDINYRFENGELDKYNWVCFDSMTFLARACHERLNWLNGNMGGLEDLGDYRIVGQKLVQTFMGISSLKCNTYMICHLNTREVKTGIDQPGKPATVIGIETMLNLPGSARSMFSTMHTDVWEFCQDNGKFIATLQHHGRHKFHRVSMWNPPLTGKKEISLQIDWTKDPKDQGIGSLFKQLG